MKILLNFLLFALCAAPAAAEQPGASYDYGMEQRRRGDHAGARETFLNMLALDPASGGALEGLALACLSLRQYEEARTALEKWNAQSPGNPYILGLLLRAQSALNDDEGALETSRELASLDPRDCALRSRLDASMERLAGGLFPYGKTYRSYSIEGLDTASPQRILYEGSSAGARFRAPLKKGLDLIGGAEIREEAQRNYGQGFTYFDIEEQTYSAGLAGRRGGLAWEAEYGRSFLSDVEGSGIGHKQVNRARASGELRLSGADLRLALNSAPKFLRGSGGTQFFKLLRENSAKAEAETDLWSWGWLARAGLYDTSDGTTLGLYSLRALREYGPYVFQASYSHDRQEFYSASAEGRLRYVRSDRLGASLRRYSPEKYRASVTAGKTYYSDENRLGEAEAELTGWLPWQKEFYGTYRFTSREFGGVRDGYDSTDETGHWLGAYWRRCRGYNWSALAGYERGFLKDSILSYGAEIMTAGAEWYAGSRGSLRLQGRRKTTTARGHSYSLGLQARYSF